jgi:hypothetical protein
MRGWWLRFVGATGDLDRARQRQELEPGERVPGGSHVRDSPFGQRPKGAQCRRRMAGVHGLGRGTTEMELWRRVVAMASWPGPALGCDDALLLEIADHAGRQADRLSSWSDSRQLVRFVVDWIVWHASNLAQMW